MRAKLLSTTAFACLVIGSAAAPVAAWAAEAAAAPAPAPAPEGGPREDLSEVVVTASRISRPGFASPTPVTTVGSAEIARLAPTTVGEVLSTVPSFVNQVGATSGGTRTRGGAVDRANLRGLNDTFATRTLVLVDGRRFVPSGSDGAVDLKLIPSMLIDNVDVVTGGASAAWGSDAVAGVVNFRLKKKMQGVEGSASYGVSEHGDNIEYHLSLGGGFEALDGRLHGLLAGDYVKNEGVANQYSRSWGRQEYGLITNTAFATNGLPNFIISPNVHPANMTPGGLIVSGPLKGTAFGPGGAPFAFQYGQVFGTSMIGGGNVGENLSNATLLETPLETKSVFTHVDFDLTPKTTLFVELAGAWSDTPGQSQQLRDAGNLVIKSDNAYLPASVRTAMLANTLATITVGRVNDDIGPVLADATNRTLRGVIGAKGDLGRGWTWDAYYQYGENSYAVDVGPNNRIQSRYTQALDAVVNPATGAIVCRSTLTAPTNGCIPVNIFGPGAATTNSYAYGTAHFTSLTRQQAAEANLRGEPVSTWAGPVSIAAGVGYREESLSTNADPISSQSNPNGSFGGWAFNNQLPVHGSFHLWEIYGEGLVPLLKDQAFAKSLDFSAAIRRTDYNLSGAVTSWKLGFTYKPVDGLLFRLTRSRDIRAPNLAELFEGGGSAQQIVFDRVLNTNVQVFDLAVGNTSLKPEKADTWSGGVTYQPPWLPGLSMSVDYYNINIAGAIASLTPAMRVNNCYAGVPGACADVVLNPNGTIAYIRHASENLNSLKTSGVDFEIDYRTRLERLGVALPGSVSLRILGTYVDSLVQTSSAGPLQEAGWLSLNSRILGVPHFTSTQELVYDNDTWSIGLRGRLIGSGHFNTIYTQGAGAANTINNNKVPAYYYLSLNGDYSFHVRGVKLTVFGVVNNLLNTDPPFIPSGAVGGAAETSTNPAFYDVIGRSYKIGVRFKF